MLKQMIKIILMLAFTTLAFANENQQLGKISFIGSENKQAQYLFEQGILLLHSFEYHKARNYFREAEKIEPNNAMAYWGEAMTYNHPIWNEQDLPAARKVLATLDKKQRTSHLTAKENGLIKAIHILYGPGNKTERDIAYASEMHDLYQLHPQDDEIATFYALSLLGKTEKVRDFATYMQAAAILEEVFARNPLHPGAAHYLIHSYDDAIHAPLGLRPARVYAKIAPAASHALHMPSHIFLALGMWDDLVSSNQAAWNAGKERRGYCETHPCDTAQFLNDLGDDLHALQWLVYGYLQKHQYQAAYQATLIAKKFAETQPSLRTKWYYSLMRAAYLSETQDWDADLKSVDLSDMALSVRANDFYVNIMILLAKGHDIKTINSQVKEFSDKIPAHAPYDKTPESYYTAITASGITIAKIAVAELKAQIKLKEGKIQEAIFLLQQAIHLEDETPLTYGPPFPVKPPHELLAEILVQNKDYSQAYQEYQRALKRAPHREVTENGLYELAKLMSEGRKKPIKGA